MTAVQAQDRSEQEIVDAYLEGDAQAQQLHGEVRRYADAAVDAVTSTSHLTAQISPHADAGETPVHGRIRLVAATKEGVMPIAIRASAHDQFAERLAIPRDYYQRMLREAPDLLVENMNHWMHERPENRLLRMFRPLPGDEALLAVTEGALSVRAVLSDRYRPLDNGSLVNAALPVLARHGARIAEFNFSDERLFVRAVGAPVDVLDLVRAEVGDRRLLDHRRDGTDLAGTVGGLTDAQLSERVTFGVSIRNSETGHSALSVEDYIRILICNNGAVASVRMRTAHVGKKREQEEEGWMRADSKRLEDAAVFLKARDRIELSFAKETHLKIAKQVVEAEGAKIALPVEMPMMTFIGNVGRRFDLSDAETEILQEEVIQEMASRSRPLTQWAVTQGVTALARRSGEAGRFDRKVELEEVGFRILSDPLSALLKAGSVN